MWSCFVCGGGSGKSGHANGSGNEWPWKGERNDFGCGADGVMVDP